MISVIITAIVSFISTNLDDIFVLMVFFSQVSVHQRKRHIIIGQYLGVIALLMISVLGAYGLNIFPQKYTGLLGIIPILLGIKEWIKYRKVNKLEIKNLYDKIEYIKPEADYTEQLNDPVTLQSDRDNIVLNNDSDNIKENVTVYIDDEPSNLQTPEILQEENTIYTLYNNDISNVTLFTDNEYSLPEESVIESKSKEHQKAVKDDKLKSILTKLINPAILNILLVTIANGADNIGVYIPLFIRLKMPELILTLIIFLLLLAGWCYLGEKLTNFPVIKQSIHKYKNMIVPVVYILIGLLILIKSEMFTLHVSKL
jgi:cadmium resistance protein CadD (predicted permease)